MNSTFSFTLTCTFSFYQVHTQECYRQNQSTVLDARVRNDFMFVCGNKMPTRRNRGFYCSSYCLLNMFRAPLCPSSGAQEYYTVDAACGIWWCGFQVVGLVWSWGLRVRFAGCCSIMQTGHITLNNCHTHVRQLRGVCEGKYVFRCEFIVPLIFKALILRG